MMSEHNPTVDMKQVDEILESLFVDLRRELRNSTWEKVDSWETADGHVVEKFYRDRWYDIQGEQCHVCGSTSTSYRTHRNVPDTGIFQCDNCETTGKTSTFCRHPGGMHPGGGHPVGDCDIPDDSAADFR